MKAFYGDIHSHCGASYGHGSVEDALHNARLQLDFCSITGHSSWPDIGSRAMPEGVRKYHQQGFARLAAGWSEFVHAHSAASRPGSFVAFPSYECHSFQAGDRVVYHRRPPEAMIIPEDFSQLQQAARNSGGDIILLPHHISYARGFRGINWDLFDETASPLVEIISLHGCSESDQAPFPPLHTMGPRSCGQTMQAGLSAGNFFGVTGSTDHHSAHPGSYGWGLTGVWAEDLTLDALWEAFLARRTWALSGDRIELSFQVDGAEMGSEITGSGPRELTYAIRGEAPLDSLEIFKNNNLIERICPRARPPRLAEQGRLRMELGWGEKGIPQEWEVRITVLGGRLTRITPKFRGVDTVDPLDEYQGAYRLSEITDRGEDFFAFRTTTRGNPTSSTAATQGCGLEIAHGGDGVLEVRANSTMRRFPLVELAQGSAAFHLGGFLSGAVRISRFVPREETTLSGTAVDDGPGGSYYLRVRQRNNHWAWSSPIRCRR
jgi:hypothetical protein